MKKSLLMLVLVSGLMVGQPLDACIMHSWDLDAQYQANSNPSVGALFSQDSEGLWFLSSFTTIGSEWAITAAHGFDTTTPYGGYFGDNAWSPYESSLIDEYHVFPDWTGTLGQGHDLALLHFSDPLSSVPIASIGTESPNLGDEIHFTGYGMAGAAGGDPQPQDGNSRGWDGYVTRFGGPGISANHLTSEWVNPGWPDSHALGGLSAPGDSGAGVFDQDGQLIAVSLGITNDGAYFYGVDTFAIGLWEEDVQTWITETTGINAVPIPGAMWLFGTGIVGLAGVKIQRKRR